MNDRANPMKSDSRPQNQVEGGIRDSWIPERLLLWVDNRHRDLASRVIRSLGIAETWQRAGVREVTLACPAVIQIAEETSIRNLQWFDNTENAAVSSLLALAAERKPQMVFVDLATPPEVEEAIRIQDAIIIALSEEFSEELLAADAALFPIISPTPDFESLRLPPSHIARCLAGRQYLSYPQSLAQAERFTGYNLLLAADHSTELEELEVWIQRISAFSHSELKLVLDWSSQREDQIRKQYPELKILGRQASLAERLDQVNSARAIIAFPSLHLYEFWLRGKAVILALRNDREAEWGQYLQSLNLCVTVDIRQPTAREQMKAKLQDLMENHDSRMVYETQAYDYLRPGMMDALVTDVLNLCNA